MKYFGIYGSQAFCDRVDMTTNMSKSNPAPLNDHIDHLSGYPLPELANMPMVDTYLDKSHQYANQYNNILESSSSSTTLVPSRSLSVSLKWSDSTFSGRCSTYSWGADEADFEKEAAEKVRRKFSRILTALYEGQSTGTIQIDQECKQWSTKFPHLVVQGVHLLDSLDDGTDMVDSDPLLRLNVSTVDIESSDRMSHKLEVMGKSLQPTPLKDLPCYNHLCEETIASDGIVEEFFAFDNSDVDSIDTHRRKKLVKRNRRLPPLTPNAAVKDTVCSLVFDQVWNEAVTILQPLVALMRERACQAGRHSSNYVLRERSLPPLSTPHDDDELSQQQPYILRGLRDPPTLTKAPGPSGSKFLRFKPSGTNLPSTLPQLTNNLSGVMQIRSVALQHRIPSIASREGTPMYFGLPESGVTGSRYLKAPTPLPQRFSSEFQLPATPANRLISSRMASRKNVVLKPIERSKTPALEPIDSGIRGYKLYGAPSISSPPSTPLVKNNQLPPLENPLIFSNKAGFGTVNNFEKSPTLQVKASVREKNRVTFNSRVGSGTDPLDSWKHSRVGNITGGGDVWPNTTNTFRHPQDGPSKIGRKLCENSMNYYGHMKVVGHAAGHHGGALETGVCRDKVATSIAEDDECTEDVSSSFAVTGTSGFFQSKPRSMSSRTKFRGHVR